MPGPATPLRAPRPRRHGSQPGGAGDGPSPGPDLGRGGRVHGRLAPARPLVGKYLLGNVSIVEIGALPILALLYGSGAVLIRELARRGGRGWPTILTLGLA
jgi:hypothetical protein